LHSLLSVRLAFSLRERVIRLVPPPSPASWKMEACERLLEFKFRLLTSVGESRFGILHRRHVFPFLAFSPSTRLPRGATISSSPFSVIGPEQPLEFFSFPAADYMCVPALVE